MTTSYTPPYVSPIHRFRSELKESEGLPVSYGQIDRDGIPFRGIPSNMTREEYEQSVTQVKDARVGYFDTKDRAQREAYEQILTRCLAGLYELLYIKRPGEFDPSNLGLAYIEYAEKYMQNVKLPAVMMDIAPVSTHRDVQHVTELDTVVAHFDFSPPKGG